MKIVFRLLSNMIVGLLLFMLPVTISAQVQKLTEQLDGVKTSVRIIWQEKELEIIDQAIFKRGLSRWKYDEEPIMEYGYGYGYGVETFRLEFVTRNTIDVIDSSFKRKFKYEIELVGLDDSILLKTNINRSDVLKYSNGEGLSTVSINLQSLPLIVLDKTDGMKISIVK